MRANCLQISVLPTPVGPANKNDPIGLSTCAKPERDNLMEVDKLSTASF